MGLFDFFNRYDFGNPNAQIMSSPLLNTAAGQDSGNYLQERQARIDSYRQANPNESSAPLRPQIQSPIKYSAPGSAGLDKILGKTKQPRPEFDFSGLGMTNVGMRPQDIKDDEAIAYKRMQDETAIREAHPGRGIAKMISSKSTPAVDYKGALPQPLNAALNNPLEQNV
jgi:hypothetical protein